MASYKEIRAQIRRLEAEAEVQRRKELKSLIADIKSKIVAHGITADDLGFGAKGRGSGDTRKAKKKNTNKGRKLPAKFRDPASGASWAGVGRPPTWLVAAEKAGKRRESFAVK